MQSDTDCLRGMLHIRLAIVYKALSDLSILLQEKSSSYTLKRQPKIHNFMETLKVQKGMRAHINKALLMGSTYLIRCAGMSLKATDIHTWDAREVVQRDSASMPLNGGNRINTGVKMGLGK